MTQQQVTQLYRTVEDYSVVRKRIMAQMRTAAQGTSPWLPNPIVNSLSRFLYSCPERQAFLQIVWVANSNSTVEKYLRAAHSEFFLGRPLDPTKL